MGKYVIGIYLFYVFAAGVLQAQNTPANFSSGNYNKERTQKQASTHTGPTTDVKDAVEFQSDSLFIDFTSGRTAKLKGSAKVTHTSGTLTSGVIDMDLETSTVEALSVTPEDSTSLPVLSTSSEEIESNRILFNFKSEKGKFEAATINVGEGQLIGSKVKNVNRDEIFIEDGVYSTCPPDYLYYYIKARKMKVVDEDEIFFTNAQIYLLDIPYPLIFPFGYVPSGIEQRKSGLLTPTYMFDDQATRGIGLNNVGWFQYINDYVTTTLSSDVYTSGTFYLNSSTQYRRADNFNGSVAVGYSRDQGLEPTDPGFVTQINRSLAVQHNQNISPFASLTANINLRTADFFNQNSLDMDDRAQTSSNSRIAYNYKDPENRFNLGTNINLNQNFFNNTTRLDGPSATFSSKTFSPFQNQGSGNTANPSWYESISFRYRNNFDTRFNYEPIDADSASIGFLDALTSPSQYREATGNDDYIRMGLQQQADLTVGKILNSAYINSSLSFSVNEYWFPTSIRKSFIADSNEVITNKVNGFVTARDFNTSFSLSTRIYGISNIQIGNLKGLRHTLTPNISFGYRPDFSDDRWGYYRTVQTDTLGNTQRYSIFEDEIYNGPGRGEQRSISFGLQNVLETKVVKRDTTGEVNETNLKLIEQFTLNSSYNFAADSLKLGTLNTSFRSSSIKGISITMRANFSFYERDSLGRRFDQFVWEDGSQLAQLERFDFSASTSFKGGNGRIRTFTPKYQAYDPFNQAVFRSIDPSFGFRPVAPLNSPWSFNLNFSYQWTYRHNQKPDINATLRAQSISFNLTPKWQFNTSLGYDFVDREIATSQFSLNRNLECWNLSFVISPFGENQFYFFSLSLNSSQIQTLFQKLPILRNLERGSSATGRGRGRTSSFMR